MPIYHLSRRSGRGAGGIAYLPGEAWPAHAILPDQTLVRRCHSQPCYDRYETTAATTSDRWLAPRLRLRGGDPFTTTSTNLEGRGALWIAYRGHASSRHEQAVFGSPWPCLKKIPGHGQSPDPGLPPPSQPNFRSTMSAARKYDQSVEILPKSCRNPAIIIRQRGTMKARPVTIRHRFPVCRLLSNHACSRRISIIKVRCLKVSFQCIDPFGFLHFEFRLCDGNQPEKLNHSTIKF